MLEVPAVIFMWHYECRNQQSLVSHGLASQHQLALVAGDAAKAYRLFSLQMCSLVRTEQTQTSSLSARAIQKAVIPISYFSIGWWELSTWRPLPSPPTGMDLCTKGRAKLQKAWLTKQKNLSNEPLPQTTCTFNRKMKTCCPAEPKRIKKEEAS